MKAIRYFLIMSCVFFTSQKNLTSQDPKMFELVGFATLGNGTTGGAGGDKITVSTGTDLQNALNAKKKSTVPLTIYINNTITPENSPGLSKIDVKDLKDVSLIGVDSLGEFNGIGIKIYKASNVIVRNIKVHHVLIGEKDCISIEGPANHIWIDHCELYNEYQGVGKDDYDGLLDAKAESEYITYSWNYLHDSWKAVLIGSSESDTFDRKLTMHHNFFENINSRLPLFRGSTGHFFNNYYVDVVSTAINSRINSCALIENNYFENVNNPWVSAYSDILGGGDTTGNILVNSPFVYSDDTHELPTCTMVPPYEYKHVLQAAKDVPATVRQYAGVGKIEIDMDQQYVLTTQIVGNGSLTIVPQKAVFDSGEVVTITPMAATNWEFHEWTGSITGNTVPLQLTMDGNKTLTAAFTADTLTHITDQQKQHGFYMFPNPVSGNLTVNLNLSGQQPVRLSLVNSLGQRKIVYEGSAEGNKDIQISLENHPKGMYLMELYVDGQRVVKRLVVE
jgi:pectate lyase